MFGVAMLKIAVELKKKAAPRALEDVVAEILKKMRVDEASFRDYLLANGGLLQAVARGPRVDPAQKSRPSQAAQTRPSGSPSAERREKLVKALKRLHPMD
jgi:hypothetical protein